MLYPEIVDVLSWLQDCSTVCCSPILAHCCILCGVQELRTRLSMLQNRRTPIDKPLFRLRFDPSVVNLDKIG
jgi:hypothetical protein